MKPLQQTSYPGSAAGVWEIFDLAGAYYQAAIVLFQQADGLGSSFLPPARMCAIHAIELYLNAFLRHDGASPGQIRARMHNLAEPQFVAKLKLRKKTAAHLEALSARREYLIARYAPEQVSEHTELSRLTATLSEVATKVGKYLHNSGHVDR